jgi:carbon monoxide dehydrogenase subunit G
VTTTRVERTTVLPGPPGDAWDAVMSPEVAPIIDPGVREWRPDREPIDVGTRFTIRARLGIIPIRGMSEVTRWEPKHIATFHSVKGAGPMKMTATHTFEPDGDGTRYTWAIEFAGPWPAAAVGAKLFGRAIEAQQRTLAAYLTEQA